MMVAAMCSWAQCATLGGKRAAEQACAHPRRAAAAAPPAAAAAAAAVLLLLPQGARLPARALPEAAGCGAAQAERLPRWFACVPAASCCGV